MSSIITLLLGVISAVLIALFVYVTVVTRKRAVEQSNLEQLQNSLMHNNGDGDAPESKQRSAFEIWLSGAGINVQPSLVILVLSILICLMLFVGITMARNVVVALLLAGLVVVGFLMIVNISRSKRSKLFDEQLAAALPMVAENLRSGMTIENAITGVAKYMDAPLSEEFTRVSRDMSCGSSLSDAFDALAERTHSSAVKLLAAVIGVQKESGGNLAYVIEKIAKSVSDIIAMQGHISAITSTGRISMIIVGGLPVMLFAVMSVIQPTYMNFFWTNPMGPVLLIAAGASETLGIAIIKSMYNIKME